jgi:branched-chain amino acid transport system ATP-binding protein
LELTAEENLEVGAFIRRDRSGVTRDLERIYGYFPRLKERRRQAAGTLSGGEQQMLAIGRVLMTRPQLLLLDEPSFGLAPQLVHAIFDILRSIRETDKVSVLLVEQNAKMALAFADYAYLLETGSVVMEGPAAEVANDEAVRRSYLGY